MTWIVLTVIFGIIFWLGVGFRLTRKTITTNNYGETKTTALYKIGTYVAAGSFGIWAIISLALMFHTVGQRQVAVVYNFSGTISGKKDPGVVTTAPWQHVRTENTGITHEEWQFDANNAAVSKDQQKITGLLAVNLQVEADKVVDLYKRVGSSWKTIIVDSRVPQVFKEVTATYPTADITANREQLRIDTRKRLEAELAPYDIKVVDVFVKNLGFSQSYTDAIEEKQRQVQDAQRAQAKVKQVEAEARQKVAQAEGEATAQVATARGEAQAIAIKGKALRNNPEILRLTAIEKLNPQVQVIYTPDGANLLLQPDAKASK